MFVGKDPPYSRRVAISGEIRAIRVAWISCRASNPTTRVRILHRPPAPCVIRAALALSGSNTQPFHRPNAHQKHGLTRRFLASMRQGLTALDVRV